MTDEAALNALREAARLSPENLPLRRHLADQLLASGNPSQAEHEYQAALALSPADHGIAIGLAEALVRQGKNEAALAALDPLLAMPEHPVRAGVLAAQAMLPVNRMAAAHWYRYSIARDPSQADPELAHRLGIGQSSPPPPSPSSPSPVPSGPAGPPVESATPSAPDTRPHAQSPAPQAQPSVSHAQPQPSPPAPHAQPQPSPPAQPASPAPAPPAQPPSLIPTAHSPSVVPAPHAQPQAPVGQYGSADVEPTAEVEHSPVTFADVAGMDTVKEALRMKLLLPTQQPELFAAYGKRAGGGVLLYGPPGAGKTHLARAAAGELGAAFVNVGLADILDMWTGSSERNLRATFAMARRNRPCVLFFDEVDALAARRSDMRQAHSRQIVNQFLAELDGVDEHANEGVLVLAATNAPWYIDVAFRRPGRFDQMVFVPPPDTVARAAMLSLMCRDKPQAKMDFDKVARATDGFVGADLKGLVDRAVEAKLHESIRAGRPIPLSTGDLMAAAKAMRPTAVREWLGTARNYVLHANESGAWDELLPWLRDLR
ncbi:AAA family ATPase [Streptosporangium sp. NBC_01756]|uniref:AAA family ATPase n=1 Tax=Streptosporangium sp. NBC_01756 TaxID=2975950 RepID=UPI002DD8E3DD|nr:AAA family ATPase [Streptosporangium sp. NBC_01756]WSC87365.1 AAA family ATPase [Streptosporangium sp. NBC_01756]